MQTVIVNQQPVVPSKIVCVGRNYLAHIEELNNAVPEAPVIFIKPNSAIAAGIRCLAHTNIHFEAEMAFLIRDHVICAVGVGLDLTKRSLQNQLKSQGLPWERAKAFDGSAVFSEFVPIDNWQGLTLTLWVNKEKRQVAEIEKVIFSPDDLLRNIDAQITLINNDILLTGTPEGVGEIEAGAHFFAQITQGQDILVEHQWIVEPACD